VRAAGVDPADVIRHDAGAADPTQQFALSRLDGADMAHVPLGVFRDVRRPTYDDLVRAQVDTAVAAKGRAPDDALAAVLAGRDTWTVGGTAAKA